MGTPTQPPNASPRRPSPRRRAALAPVLAGVLVAGCLARAQEPPPAAPPAPSPAVRSADPDWLIAELEAGVADYEAGLELVQTDYDWLGEEKIAAASERLREAAERCAATVGCELAPFVSSYQRLLSRQAQILAERGARLETLEETLEETVEPEEGTTPFLGEMPELDRAVSLLRGTELRDLITLNGPVNAALDDWLTWLRPDLLDAWYNYQFLRPKMAPVYQDAGLPEALLFAMLATESRGKVHATSRAGAAGPLQFIGPTGRKYGLVEVDGFDLRFDPEAATRANVAYLSEHLKLFNNSLEKVLAAYNGGENRMKGVQRRHGDASFWESEVYYSFPAETRDYVPRVLAAAWLFLHPEDYGLELPTPPTATTRLTLRREQSVGELAICLGQKGNPDGWFRTLRNLNPRVTPSERIPAGHAIEVPAPLAQLYEERCLDGDLVERARVLHEANYPEEPAMIPYTVRAGDTLHSISARHRCAGLREIAEINRIRAPRYVIRVGQRLLVPACP